LARSEETLAIDIAAQGWDVEFEKMALMLEWMNQVILTNASDHLKERLKTFINGCFTY